MFAATAVLIALIVWITGARGGSPPSSPLSIKVADLPEGEMHLIELAVMSVSVSMIATIMAMVLSAL